jgi:hypothetical protein
LRFNSLKGTKGRYSHPKNSSGFLLSSPYFCGLKR